MISCRHSFDGGGESSPVRLLFLSLHPSIYSHLKAAADAEWKGRESEMAYQCSLTRRLMTDADDHESGLRDLYLEK